MLHPSVERHHSDFPIKCSDCCHTENVTKGLSPFFMEDDCDVNSGKPLAIDCEMVGVGPKKLSGLGRVSIVDYSGNLLYDVMVRPDEVITDFRTPWSGIQPSDMLRSIPFECAQEQVERIIRNRIVVGHMVHNDFSVLRIMHPPKLVRDTAKSPLVRLLAGYQNRTCVSLRALTLRLFGVHIQSGAHCSTEDARATMAIYRLAENTWEPSVPAKRSITERVNGGQVAENPSTQNRRVVYPRQRPGKRQYPSDDELHGHSSTFPWTKKCSPLSVHHRFHSQPCLAIYSPSNGSSHSSLLDDDFWPSSVIELDAPVVTDAIQKG